MLDELSQQINDMLVMCFRSVLDYEEQALKKLEKIELTIAEVHLIEAVGLDDNRPKSVGELATTLGVRPPSVTAAVAKIVRKGYAEKWRDERDARVVQIILTKQGLRIDRMHRYFHERMTRAVVAQLSSEERSVMLQSVTKLTAFFRKKTDELEAQTAADSHSGKKGD